MKKVTFLICSLFLLWLAGCTVSKNTVSASAPAVVAPQLSGSLVPASVTAGSAGFNLTVQGANFSSTCAVLWNGQQRPTTVVSSTQVVAAIAQSDVALPASVTINVVDTNTGSRSNSVTFVITSGAPAIQHHAMLSWTPSSSSVIGYKVYRGAQSSGPYGLLNSAIVNAETFTDSTVASGQTYFYVVSAVDSAGLESTFSNESVAVIPSP